VLDHVEGVWRFEEGWPIERIRDETLHPQPDHGLGPGAPARGTHELRNVPSSGVEAGGPVMWWGDAAHDQRPTDAFSLIYDSPPLEADLEILGFPRALLRASADAPLADWFVRLSDVAPDGSVTQVTGAGANGAHRLSAREPSPLAPGETVSLDVELHFTSWVFPKGHRVRLSIGNAQWPMFWPKPYPVTTTLRLGGDDPTRLVLPVVPHGPARPVPAFLTPEPDPELPGFESLDTGTVSGYGEISRIERNPVTRTARVTARNASATRYPWGTERLEETITHETSDDHPEATSVLGEYRTTVELPERTLVWEAKVSFRSDRPSFYLDITRRLLENGVLVREKRWEEAIPRDFQ
jgi:predicted acyl esterase